MQSITRNSPESLETTDLVKYPKIAFIHVPKCAGVSVSMNLCKALYPASLRINRMVETIDLQASQKCHELFNINMMRAREIVFTNYLIDPEKIFITGHCHAAPNLVAEFCNDWNFLTVLRNPIDKFISQYVYNCCKESNWAKLDQSIEKFIQSDRAKVWGVTISRYFSGLEIEEIWADPERAIELSINNLANFKSVGFVNELDQWYAKIEKMFSCEIKISTENSSPNKEMFDEIKSNKHLLSSISELAAVDIQLFDIALNKFRIQK